MTYPGSLLLFGICGTAEIFCSLLGLPFPGLPLLNDGSPICDQRTAAIRGAVNKDAVNKDAVKPSTSDPRRLSSRGIPKVRAIAIMGDPIRACHHVGSHTCVPSRGIPKERAIMWDPISVCQRVEMKVRASMDQSCNQLESHEESETNPHGSGQNQARNLRGS